MLCGCWWTTVISVCEHMRIVVCLFVLNTCCLWLVTCEHVMCHVSCLMWCMDSSYLCDVWIFDIVLIFMCGQCIFDIWYYTLVSVFELSYAAYMFRLKFSLTIHFRLFSDRIYPFLYFRLSRYRFCSRLFCSHSRFGLKIWKRKW